MNYQKTKFFMYGNNVQLSKCSTKHIENSDEIIGCSDMIILLGFYIDNNLTFKEHIKKKCNVAMYNLHNIRSMAKLPKHCIWTSHITIILQKCHVLNITCINNQTLD